MKLVPNMAHRAHMGAESLERALYAHLAAADASFLAHERNLPEELPQKLSVGCSRRERELFFGRVLALRPQTSRFRHSLLNRAHSLPRTSAKQLGRLVDASYSASIWLTCQIGMA